MDIPIDCPSLSETIVAIRAFRGDKSLRSDDITPEILKTDPSTNAHLSLVEAFWDNQLFLSGLIEGLIIKIPQEGQPLGL